MVEAEASIVIIPAVEVTVQEDRALVRREGSVTLPPGRSRLRIEGVAPVLVDKSLTAELSGPVEAPAPAGSPRPRVCAVRARRWRVTEGSARPVAVATLETQRHQLEARLKTLTMRRVDLDAERDLTGSLLETTIAELSEDAGWGRVDGAATHQPLDELERRLLELGSQRCQLEAEHERLQHDRSDLERLYRLSQTTEARAAAALELEVHNPAASPCAWVLRVDYLVPGALWRPWHRARLYEDESGARVRLCSEGCVWQATGEDWTDVQVWLSTERPSLGLTPPPLRTDELRLRKQGPAVEVETRQEQIHTAGLGSDGDAEGEGDDDGGAEPANELPGIDDGGQAQRLRGIGRRTILGDGRPHRVPLFESEGAARVELRCVPELASAVLLRSEQTNAASLPLLAGPVDLVRNSGLVGRTSILYVAPGERYELGWGPDNALRVSREVEALEWERKTLGAWTRKPRRVRIKLSNLEGAPRSLRVDERIAVSEIDKVRVNLDNAEPRARPDDDGFVRWDVHLPGFGRQELRLEWSLTVHDDVQGV